MNAMGIALWVRRRTWLAYLLGAVLALAGWGVRALFLPGLTGVPFITFFPIIVLTAFVAGFGPALLCTIISAMLSGIFWVERDLALALPLFSAFAALVAFSVSYAVRAYQRLESFETDGKRQLEAQIASRTIERDRLWSLSQDPFLIADRDGMWLAASPAWERILGWPLESLLGDGSRAVLHPDDREATARERDFVFGGGTSVRFQNRYRARDGEYRWFSWNAVAEGDLLYCVVRDVTEVRETARALAQTQEALVQSQKIEAMGKVTGGVAHDFNNLLTPILGGLDLLQRRGLPDAKAARLVDGALQAAERARVLVQRLLAFARRQPLQVAPVDLAEMIDSLSELLESTLGPRVKLARDLPASLAPIQADPVQLEMALINLAVNARDAMPDGGILSLAAGNVRITGSGEGLEPGSYVRLTVSDTGVGMSPQVLERAVEPFYSTKGIGRGTGLGLSMVHGLMAQLGGALRIESTPGQGTRIHLWLLAGDNQPARNTMGFAAPVAGGASGKVLLVDDEDVVRASVASMLDDLGYEVTEADSAAAALALLDQRDGFDLIVTDHLMPGMTGTELAAEVKRRKPGQRLVIISGYSDLDQIAPDLPRLAKPFKQDELVQVIGA
jgi:PAS domain S-box-containing protein